MRALWMLALVLAFDGGGARAADNGPKRVHPPYFLRSKDKIPPDSLSHPMASLVDANGQAMESKENISTPDSSVMDRLSDPGLFEEIRKTKSVETTPDRLYWHSRDDLNYCHYLDEEGNHWYGWTDEQGFNWVLWRGHRYWWHDPFAKHWLYYYQGYWWRADGQGKDSIQVCVDGEYFLSNGRGDVLSDMGQDGTGGIISAPGRYQGDMHHGGSHGEGHHGEGGHGDGAGGNGGDANSAPGANPAGAAGAN
jgi:hypothetical protein